MDFEIATGTISSGSPQVFTVYPGAGWDILTVLLIFLAFLGLVDLIRRIFAPYSK